MSEYSMGYYGGGNADGYYEDQYEEEPQPQQRQQNGQGLRKHLERVLKENADLRAKVDSQDAALRDMAGENPQPRHGAWAPASTVSAEEQMNMRRLQEAGMYGAAPQGSAAEQMARINACRNADELTRYLQSQGMNALPNYTGTGEQ